MTRPGIEEILAYLCGEATPVQAEQLRSLEASDPTFARQLRSAATTIDTLRSDRTPSVPAEWLASARALFKPQPRTAAPGWLESAVQRLAALVYDSRVQPSLAGFRGADDAVQLAFEAGETEIDVQVLPPGDTPVTRVIGQISGSAGARMDVALIESQTGTLVDSGAADDSGVFTLLAAAPGEYDIFVNAGTEVLKLERVRIV